jgi:putative hemolysin
VEKLKTNSNEKYKTKQIYNINKPQSNPCDHQFCTTVTNYAACLQQNPAAAAAAAAAAYILSTGSVFTRLINKGGL